MSNLLTWIRYNFRLSLCSLIWLVSCRCILGLSAICYFIWIVNCRCILWLSIIYNSTRLVSCWYILRLSAISNSIWLVSFRSILWLSIVNSICWVYGRIILMHIHLMCICHRKAILPGWMLDQYQMICIIWLKMVMSDDASEMVKMKVIFCQLMYNSQIICYY